jgi:hypothetical protein
MSFASAIKNPLGIQITIDTPKITGIASDLTILVVSQVLAKGMWVCNVNAIEITCDDFPTGKINNMRQSIFYGAVIKDQSSIIGTSIYGGELSSIAFIQTDGITPVSISIYAKTTDASTWSLDEGFMTFTRIY